MSTYFTTPAYLTNGDGIRVLDHTSWSRTNWLGNRTLLTLWTTVALSECSLLTNFCISWKFSVSGSATLRTAFLLSLLKLALRLRALLFNTSFTGGCKVPSSFFCRSMKLINMRISVWFCNRYGQPQPVFVLTPTVEALCTLFEYHFMEAV